MLWLVALFSTAAVALQFLRATTLIGAGNGSAGGHGMDFAVYRAIDVTAIGVFDADVRGFRGNSSARIFDRSTDRVVGGPVYVDSSDARTDDENPFVFKNVSRVRLPPGVYCLLGDWISRRWVSQFEFGAWLCCRRRQRRRCRAGDKCGGRWRRLHGVCSNDAQSWLLCGRRHVCV